MPITSSPQGGTSSGGSGKAGIASAVISGVGAAARGLFGWIGQKKQNQIQRDFEREMYEKNKADSIAFWNLQNEYNTPAAQMERLKAAGLNPNLVYGNGADAMSADLRVPSPSISNSTDFRNPIPDHSIASQILALRQTSAQTDLIAAQQATQESIAKLNSYTSLLTAINANKGKVELGFLPRMLESAIGKTIAETQNTRTRTRTETISQQKLKQEINNLVDENSRKWIDQRWSIRNIASEMAKRIQDMKESESRITLNKAHESNVTQDTLKKEVETRILEYMQNYKENFGISIDASPFQKLQHFGGQAIEDFKAWLKEMAQDLQPNYYQKFKF